MSYGLLTACHYRNSFGNKNFSIQEQEKATMFVQQFANTLFKLTCKPALAVLALVAFFNLALVANSQATWDLRYGDDGYIYFWDGSNWVFEGGGDRTFPDSNNNAVYDLFVDGVPYERWDFGYRPGYAGVYSHATGTWQQYPMTSAYDPYRVYTLHPDGYVADLGSALVELAALVSQLQAATAQQNADAAAHYAKLLKRRNDERLMANNAIANGVAPSLFKLDINPNN